MSTALVTHETSLEQALHAGCLNSEEGTADSAFEVFAGERSAEEVLSLFNTIEYDTEYDYKKLRGKK